MISRATVVLPPGCQRKLWGHLSPLPSGVLPRNSTVLPTKFLPMGWGTAIVKRPPLDLVPIIWTPSMKAFTRVPSWAACPSISTLPWKVWGASDLKSDGTGRGCLGNVWGSWGNGWVVPFNSREILCTRPGSQNKVCGNWTLEPLDNCAANSTFLPL